MSVQRITIELPGASAKSDKSRMMRMKGDMKIGIIVTARDAIHQRCDTPEILCCVSGERKVLSRISTC